MFTPTVKWLIFGGLGLIVLGLLIGLGIPLGKLPGDFHYKKGNTSFYFPVATTLLLSLLLNLILYWFRK